MVEEAGSPQGLPESSDPRHRATLLSLVDELRSEKREFTQGVIHRIEPALDAYLKSLPPCTLEQARELAKSLGAVFREFGLSARGKGTYSEKPCLLAVDHGGSGHQKPPRYRLQLKSFPHEDATARYSLINGRTFTENIADLLPFRLIESPYRPTGFIRWAERAAGQATRESSPNR